jgi:hypothetical protein
LNILWGKVGHVVPGLEVAFAPDDGGDLEFGVKM